MKSMPIREGKRSKRVVFRVGHMGKGTRAKPGPFLYPGYRFWHAFGDVSVFHILAVPGKA